jgi:hypothetical protein
MSIEMQIDSVQQDLDHKKNELKNAEEKLEAADAALELQTEEGSLKRALQAARDTAWDLVGNIQQQIADFETELERLLKLEDQQRDLEEQTMEKMREAEENQEEEERLW